MKNICKKIILISVFLNIFCILDCGINSGVVYAAPNSINETMSKEEIMKKYYELKKDNQELIEKYDKLNGKWSSKKDNIDNRLDKIEIYGKSILVILGISIFQVIKDIKNKIKSVVENEVNNKVPMVVENEISNKVPKEVSEQVSKKTKEEIEYIERTAQECKREQTLMEEKNIIVISKNKEEEKLLEDSNLLNQFEKVKMAIIDNKINNLAEYDVILFNDIRGNLENEEMNKIIDGNIDNKKNAVYFYFTRNYKRTFKSNKSNNTNFAKSNSTFVGNLIDLMKYQDDVLKNKKSNNESIGCCEDTVMKILIKHQGEEFFQKRGQAFTYEIKGKYIVPSTTNYNIPISDIVKGLKKGVVTTTTQLQELRGPSYIYAFINDARFKMCCEKDGE
ncbi:NARF domain-containing protein [Clostridium oceanicum]|uniref:Nucleotidyltransferase-Associated Rossmannoid Fold domain-containing protein n=1 Tax=Clostridium oceanicum TaxID=1543 RepID=A0ABN1JK86_9CLOT